LLKSGYIMRMNIRESACSISPENDQKEHNRHPRMPLSGIKFENGRSLDRSLRYLRPETCRNDNDKDMLNGCKKGTQPEGGEKGKMQGEISDSGSNHVAIRYVVIVSHRGDGACLLWAERGIL
jgi:hypothetical protein